MINKGRLQAFTILEVTIAMLLAAITIGIAYTAYRIVGNSYKDFDRKNEQLSEFVLAGKLLRQDLAGAISVISSADGLKVETGQGIIEYSFRPDYLLRDQYQLRTDTFFIPCSDLIRTFENQPAEEEALVDQISFMTELGGSAIELQFSKTYSSQELMK